MKLYKWWHVVLLSSGVEYTISIAPFPYRKPEGEVVRCGAGSSSSSSPPRSEWLVVGEGGVRSIVHNLEAIRYGAEPSAVVRIRIQGPSGSGSKMLNQHKIILLFTTLSTLYLSIDFFDDKMVPV